MTSRKAVDMLMQTMEEYANWGFHFMEDKLIDEDILDSFDIIAIVSEVNDFFNIELNVNDLLPENFNSAAALYDLIKKVSKG